MTWSSEIKDAMVYNDFVIFPLVKKQGGKIKVLKNDFSLYD